MTFQEVSQTLRKDMDLWEKAYVWIHSSAMGLYVGV